MAAGDARPFPLKGQAYRVTFPIFTSLGALVSGAAGLDSEISKDGGAWADCANEATEIGSGGLYYLDLSATEMNADTVAIIVKTTTSGAQTTPLVLYPVEAGDITVNVEQISGDATAADNCEAFFDGTGYAGGTTKLDVNVTGIGASAVDSIHDEVVEGSTTLRQAVRLLLSVLVGKSGGGGTSTITFRDLADTKNRISATVNASGDRAAVTRDAT